MTRRLSIILTALCAALVLPALIIAQTSGGTSKTRAKKARVKTGPATVVTDDADNSAPRLMSTTGRTGPNANTKAWPSFEALQKAADDKNPDACFELGIMHLEGSLPHVPQSTPSALLYLEAAARLGQRDANFRLGKMYSEGSLIPKDYPKSLAYYTAAARAGDPIAQHNVGAMISSGRGVPKRNYSEGLAWLIIAARKNPGAAESEAKLRTFLTKRPDWIIAGEKRAEELAQELATPAQPFPTSTAQQNPVIKPDPIKMDLAPAKIDIAPMPITPITIPPPAPNNAQ